MNFTFMEEPIKIPIPEIFHTFEKEKFKSCLKCQCDLTEEEQDYIIERAFIPDDVVFEYAICMDCALSMRESMSVESRQTLDKFFEQHASKHFFNRIQLLSKPDLDINECIGTCMVTGQKISSLERYQIVGYFKGGFLQPFMPPFMISEQAAEMVQQMLSAETKDGFDDFVDEFLGLPPELKELFKDSDILILT